MVAIIGDIVYICRRNIKNVSTTKLLTEIQRVSNWGCVIIHLSQIESRFAREPLARRSQIKQNY